MVCLGPEFHFPDASLLRLWPEASLPSRPVHGLLECPHNMVAVPSGVRLRRGSAQEVVLPLPSGLGSHSVASTGLYWPEAGP